MILLFLSSTYFLEEENSVTKPQYNYKHRGDSTLVQSQSLIHTAHSNFTSCSNNVFITFFFFITVQDVMQIYAFHFTVIYIFSVLYFGVVLQPFFIFYDLDIFFKKSRSVLLQHFPHVGYASFALSCHRIDVVFTVYHIKRDMMLATLTLITWYKNDCH